MLRLLGRIRLPIKRTVVICSILLVMIASIFVDAPAQAQGIASLPESVGNPATVLGVATNAPSSLPGISWVRIGYITCGAGSLSGSKLKSTIQAYHRHGVHVLLTICQPRPSQLLNTKPLKDAAQGHADAVQCGNEEMKGGKYNIYIPPQQFAAFFDLCQRTVHKVNPSTTILLGSLDPHVARYDLKLLLGEVQYLDKMQQAMNSRVHKGGHWSWRSQILGLINSWHDGYRPSYTNNLRDLFYFWAREFRTSINHLGKHLWVVEDTGCFKGCGLNVKNKKQVAIAHILALITDVQTAMHYHVPFFFFSARDFFASGVYWPIGILNSKGHPKPLRQDLPMGSRSLIMTCGKRHPKVITQEQLLATMYRGCSLPANYYRILTY